MMHEKYRSYFWIVGLLSFFCSRIDANILTVTSLDDSLGSVATLRQTILDAMSGDIIEFSVSGTIYLDNALGQLVINKQLTIDGGDSIVIDGSNLINTCLNITGASASNSKITNITIQNFNGHLVPQELEAYGVLIGGGAVDCSVTNIVIKNINSGRGRISSGIRANTNVGTITQNTITEITSEDNVSGNSGTVIGVISLGELRGEFSYNTIYSLDSGSASNASGFVYGLFVSNEVSGDVLHNTIYDLRSGSANNTNFVVGMVFFDEVIGDVLNNTIFKLSSSSGNNDSGTVYGMSFSVDISGKLLHNTIYELSSGTAVNDSGFVVGLIFFGEVSDDVSNNNISNLVSGDALNKSQSVHGIFFHRALSADSSYNIIQQLVLGDSPDDTEPVGGIIIQQIPIDNAHDDVDDPIGVFRMLPADYGSIIESNAISSLTGNGGEVFGIRVSIGDMLLIRNNTIESIQNNNGLAYGLLLGHEGEFCSNSLVFCNSINSIFGSNDRGFGVTVIGDGSVGNDLLDNSIFDINGKAISILTSVDAEVNLELIGCFSGGRITVKVFIESLIGSAIEDFLVQFFVSDVKNPSQTKTFIGESIVGAGSSTVRFVPKTPVTFGQFITATATALPLGSDVQNDNTSEVSNALAACEPVATFCPLFPGVSSSKPCQVVTSDETCPGCVAS